MHIEDLTDRAKAWSKLTRLAFNSELEKWYNEGAASAEKDNETTRPITPI